MNTHNRDRRLRHLDRLEAARRPSPEEAAYYAKRDADAARQITSLAPQFGMTADDLRALLLADFVRDPDDPHGPDLRETIGDWLTWQLTGRVPPKGPDPL